MACVAFPGVVIKRQTWLVLPFQVLLLKGIHGLCCISRCCWKADTACVAFPSVVIERQTPLVMPFQVLLSKGIHGWCCLSRLCY